MNDFNIEEFARMFDAALSSDNPAVKKALRNFMMVAAIVHAEDGGQRIAGPLETLIKQVETLDRTVRELQNTRTYRDQYKDYYNNPTWVYSPNTSTTSGTTTWSYPNSVDVDDAMIKQLIREVNGDKTKS